MGEGIGALENALLDAHAKRLGVPCYEVLGGKVRDALRVYWSHCPAWRINHPQHYGPAITTWPASRRRRPRCASAASASKTNLFIHDEGPSFAWRPGFPRSRPS